MAAATLMPNGMIVVLMTPREAVMVMDELLEPEKYPWQRSESETTANGLAMQLRGCVLDDSMSSLSVATSQLMENMKGSGEE